MSKRKKLIIVILILAFLGGLVVFVSANFIKGKMIESLIDEEAKSQLVLTEQVAHSLEGEIRSVHDKLELIASFPQIQNENTADCNKKLAEVEEDIKSQLDNITRFHSSLVLDCAINQKAIGFTLPPDSDITAVIENPEHKPYLSYAGFSPVSNQYVLYLNVPVYNPEGEYVGIIGGVIYLNYLGDKYLKHIKVGEGGYFVMFDDNDVILHHPDNSLIGKSYFSDEVQNLTNNSQALLDLNQKVLADSHAGKSGIVSYIFQNKQIVAVYAPANIFPGRTWTIISTVPIESIIAKIERNKKFGGLSFFVSLYSAFLLVFILFSAFVLVLITKGLLNPLDKLKNVMERIGQGDFQAEIDSELLSSQDEFGALSAALQQTKNKLKDYYSGLEGKVKDKTAELGKKVKELEDTQTAMINVMEDLEATKDLIEIAKAKDEAMLASIGEGLIAIDHEKRILVMNKAAEQMSGWKMSEVIGKDVTSIPLADEGGTIVPLDKRPTSLALSQDKTTNTTYYLVRKDKTRFPIAIIVTPIKLGGKIIGALDIFRDITREREIDKAKSEFVSLASHQLRTPLGIAKWYLEAIKNENSMNKASQQARDYLDEVYKSNERVLSLVRDLLSISRIDQGKVKNTPQNVDLVELIQRVIKELTILVTKTNVTLLLEMKIPKIFTLYIDPSRVQEVIENLITNAITYSAPKGIVKITVDTKDSMVSFAIKDSGIGISEADKKMLFTKFFRSEKAIEKNAEGSGLGLYVVKSYVEEWGGTISVVSEEGKGSTFSIKLPIETSPKGKGKIPAIKKFKEESHLVQDDVMQSPAMRGQKEVV